MSRLFTVLVFLLVSHAVEYAAGCGTVEEGSKTALRCLPNDAEDFTSFGVEARSASGTSRFLSTCLKNSTCTDNEPGKYRAELEEITTLEQTARNLSHYVLTLVMNSVNRNDTELHCVKDGFTQAKCELDVYVNPEKPVCSQATFIQNGTVIFLECTADRVYPDASCSFTVDDKVRVDDSLVFASHRPSERFPGDKEVTCQLRVPVRNHPEGDYHFQAAVLPKVPFSTPEERTNAFVFGDSPASIKLSPVAFSYAVDDDITFNIKAGTNLKTEIHITGSPPPNRFSLQLKIPDSANTLTVPRGDYGVSYSSGKLHLEVRNVGDTGAGFGSYIFRASNGVEAAPPELEYKFELLEKDDDDDDTRIKLILAAVIPSVIVIVLAILALWIYRNRKRKRAERGGSRFDAAHGGGVAYIYPNMGFQMDPTNYGPDAPPPYNSNEHIYSHPNEYIELHSDSEPAVPPEKVPGAEGGHAHPPHLPPPKLP